MVDPDEAARLVDISRVVIDLRKDDDADQHPQISSHVVKATSSWILKKRKERRRNWRRLMKKSGCANGI